MSDGKPLDMSVTEAEFAAARRRADALEAELKSAPKAEHPDIIRRAMAAARKNRHPDQIARTNALRLAIAEGRARVITDKKERRAVVRRDLADLDAHFEALQSVRIDTIAAEHGIARDDLKRLKPVVMADPQMIAIGKEWAHAREVQKMLARSPAIPIVQSGEPIRWVTPDALQH
jgi:hypothetical protein